jgi:hypothetical protein
LNSSSERRFQRNKFLGRGKQPLPAKFITLQFASLSNLRPKIVQSRAKVIIFVKIHYVENSVLMLNFLGGSILTKEMHMTKEIVKHRKEEKKKPALSLKERRVKKQEKKQTKKGE